MSHKKVGYDWQHIPCSKPSSSTSGYHTAISQEAFGSPSRFAVLEEGEDAFVQQLDARAFGKSRAAGLLGIKGSSSHVELLGSHLQMGSTVSSEMPLLEAANSESEIAFLSDGSADEVNERTIASDGCRRHAFTVPSLSASVSFDAKSTDSGSGASSGQLSAATFSRLDFAQEVEHLQVPSGADLSSRLLSAIRETFPHLLISAQSGLSAPPVHATHDELLQAQVRARDSVGKLIQLASSVSNGQIRLDDQDFVRASERVHIYLFYPREKCPSGEIFDPEGPYTTRNIVRKGLNSKVAYGTDTYMRRKEVLLKDKIKLNSRNPDMADEDVLGFKLRDTSFQIACDTFKSSVDGSVADDQVPLRSFAFFGAPNRVLARKWIDELVQSHAGHLRASRVAVEIPVPKIGSLGLLGTNTEVETLLISTGSRLIGLVWLVDHPSQGLCSRGFRTSATLAAGIAVDAVLNFSSLFANGTEPTQGTENIFTVDHHPDPKLHFSLSDSLSKGGMSSIALLRLCKARRYEQASGRPATIQSIGAIAERYLVDKGILEPNTPGFHTGFLRHALQVLGREGGLKGHAAVVSKFMKEGGLTEAEASSKLGEMGYQAVISKIMAEHGLDEPAARSMFGEMGYQAVISKIMAEHGLDEPAARSMFGEMGYQALVSKIMAEHGLDESEARSKQAEIMYAAHVDQVMNKEGVTEQEARTLIGRAAAANSFDAKQEKGIARLQAAGLDETDAIRAFHKKMAANLPDIKPTGLEKYMKRVKELQELDDDLVAPAHFCSDLIIFGAVPYEMFQDSGGLEQVHAAIGRLLLQLAGKEVKRGGLAFLEKQNGLGWCLVPTERPDHTGLSFRRFCTRWKMAIGNAATLTSARIVAFTRDELKWIAGVIVTGRVSFTTKKVAHVFEPETTASVLARFQDVSSSEFGVVRDADVTSCWPIFKEVKPGERLGGCTWPSDTALSNKRDRDKKRHERNTEQKIMAVQQKRKQADQNCGPKKKSRKSD